MKIQAVYALAVFSRPSIKLLVENDDESCFWSRTLLTFLTVSLFFSRRPRHFVKRDRPTETRGELVRFLSCFWLLRSSGTPHVLEPRAACIAIAYELIF